MIVAGMVLVFLIIGCVSKKDDRGRVIAQPRKGEKVSIQQLTDDFTKYKVYYAGIKPVVAVGVLFIPKDSDRTLTPDRWWNIVEDQKYLSNIVSWVLARADIHLPTVQLIMGPNSQMFGYIYTYNINTKLKVLSENEILVYAPVP
jgi:hypothetical protein